jgi:uncharacterized metal-binding protein YceD (DUF177 family)
MNRALREYRIGFTGLKHGKHEFQFHLGDKFFTAFEYALIEKADISVDVTLDKQSSMMVVDTHLHGTAEVPCDRCGDPISQPVSEHHQLVVKFGEETLEENDILVLGPKEFELDLSQVFYEISSLSLPARHVHADEKDCNQQVLATLSQYAVDSNPDDAYLELKDMHVEESHGLEYFDEEE